MLFKQKKNVHTLRKRLYQLHRQNNDKNIAYANTKYISKFSLYKNIKHIFKSNISQLEISFETTQTCI